MHHVLTIDASPGQLRKLRAGRPVRIKKGTGFNLIVHPGTYNVVSRAFAKNAGSQITLSPEEIELNRQTSPEQHQLLKESQDGEFAGQGIFGHKFDRMLKKAGIKKAAYAIGEHFKTPLKAALTAGIATGATALGTAQPELLPLIAPGAVGLTTLATDYIDNPNKYLGKSGIKGTPVRSLAEKAIKTAANERLNKEFGTNYDYLSRAGLDNALANEMGSKMSESSYLGRFGQQPAPYSMNAGIEGHGIHNHERKVHGGTIGLHGSIVHRAPALKSQPMSANFQFQHFLPPAYQGYNSGAGLYAGKGLYS